MSHFFIMQGILISIYIEREKLEAGWVTRGRDD